MNALHSFFGIGALVSPVIVAVVVSLGHNAVDTYPLIALLLIPVGVWLLRMPAPMAPAAGVAQPATASNKRLVLLLASFLFLYVGAEVSFGGWIFTYTVTLKLSSAANAAYLTSAFWGSLTVGRLLGIPIAKRIRHSYVLLADLAGCLLSLGFILVFSHSFAAMVAGVIGVGLCMSSIFPAVLSFAGQQLTLSGHVTGRLIVGASLGAMTVPLLIGHVFETLGPQVVMLVVLIALILAGAILIYLLRQLLGNQRGSVTAV
jgi:FHS family Na+ dependent glucose MFS transporter 1